MALRLAIRVASFAAAALIFLSAAALAEPRPDAGAGDAAGATDADADAVPAAGAPPHDAGAGDAGPSFEPPRALADTNVPYPPGAPPQTVPIVVTVKLLVDTAGIVQKVEVRTPPQPIFDDAVVAEARAFRFAPARYGGTPVPVEIAFTHTFLPPPPPAPVRQVDEGPARTAVLRGKLVELGTRAPVTDAIVTAVVGERRYSVDADRRGRFRLPLPPGSARVSVYAPSHNPFVQEETLAAGQEVAVSYFVERDRYDPYEIVVVGEQHREEVSRITLHGRELQQIPGTFGDPFRVIQTLPGVASVVSLLPFPVVRGASPASTGFLLDGTTIPLLYHLLVGTSVVHPEFIDEIQFYPGGAPAPYGQYTGGIIDGRTARARPDEHLLDFDLNLLQSGAFVREPIPQLGVSFTAAARYGYPGFLLGLATNQISLSYWDYQLRLDGGNARNGWTVFAYGANDELDTRAATSPPGSPAPQLTPTLILGFDRLDLRDHRTSGRFDETARMVLGYDHTFSMGTDFEIWSAEPSLTARWIQSEKLTLDGGLWGSLRDIVQGMGANAAAGALAEITSSLDRFYVGSAYLEALWRPTPRYLIRPGIRGDVYNDGTTTASSADPRLTVRYRLFDRDLPDVAAGSDDSAVWLKGSAGIYHQPPRFVLPLPGLDMLPLKYGILQSYQTSLGAEIPLQNRFQFSIEGYFNYMDPTIFDLAVNATSVGTPYNTTLFPTSIATQTMDAQQIIDRLTHPELGRAYGLEFLLRRQSKSGIFGWISYTISRSEREQGSQWVPYDFDRLQLLNLVVGMPLARNWDLGLRGQYESGRPTTTTAATAATPANPMPGYNAARTDGYWRIDLRVDKRAVWKKWLLDFYVDITNVALLPEEIEPGTVIRYVLPTVGLRARL
ncbi:MAG TPA: carboxypeptidase regulatory-like domain-containing protein [Polyangia bacterium]|nr:carboxypeptidase regulatory-like domain-containing protein [Polyangia bacterium]